MNGESNGVWTLTIACGGSERPLCVVAASCAVEKGDRFVFRDGEGAWLGEIAMGAVIAGPVLTTGESGMAAAANLNDERD